MFRSRVGGREDVCTVRALYLSPFELVGELSMLSASTDLSKQQGCLDWVPICLPTDHGWLEVLAGILNGCCLGPSRLGSSVARPGSYLEPWSTTDRQILSAGPSTESYKTKLAIWPLAAGCSENRAIVFLYRGSPLSRLRIAVRLREALRIVSVSSGCKLVEVIWDSGGLWSVSLNGTTEARND